MLNKNDVTLRLQALGLARDEAKMYLELLISPASHQKLARSTGIDRTKIYRLANDLEKRSLIRSQTDAEGTLLTAADPSTLEIDLVTREQILKSQRSLLTQLLPQLDSIQKDVAGQLSFNVQTYEGVEGFKQMLWHELKTQQEMLILGSGSLENLVESKRWAEKHRALTVEAGYKIRELVNINKKSDVFTKNDAFMQRYQKRTLATTMLCVDDQVVIYNDTVATYHWHNDRKVGVEINNCNYANMMRQIFEQFWQLCDVSTKDAVL